MPSLTDTLCTACGLCCDGSLFADVELAGRPEATRLEILGLDIDDTDPNGALLALPCVALHGTRCSIYEHRPKCCKTFECRLLQDAQRGVVSVEQAQGLISEAHQAIGRTEALLAQLRRGDQRLPLTERCNEALAATSDPRLEQKRADLEAAISTVQGMIRKSFLPDR